MSKRKTPDDADRPEVPQRASDTDRLAARHLQFGWWALVIFASLGLALESMHGFKVDWYVHGDFEIRRTMWRLAAHAHGTLFSLVHIAFAASIPRLDSGDSRWRHIASPCLYAAALTLPIGFFLGGVFTYSADPGLGIVLVPIGGVLLIVAAWLIALGVRNPRD